MWSHCFLARFRELIIKRVLTEYIYIYTMGGRLLLQG